MCSEGERAGGWVLPRPVDYCSTRVGIRTKNGAHAPTSGALYRATMNDQSSDAIHPSAWKWNSQKFTCRILYSPGLIGPESLYSLGWALNPEPHILWCCIKMRGAEWVERLHSKLFYAPYFSP
jgi:hypothetical protein